MRSLLPVAALSLILSACAKDQGEYPSLARRPVERISGTAPVVAPAEVAPPAPSPELSGNLEQLVAKARAADARFRDNAPRARALVSAAAGAAVASESWSVATVALADLESQRSQAMIALADLDALYAAEGIKLADTSAIAAARDQVISIVGEEDTVLNGLKSRLRS
ncbi:hypothetical protein [Novosphingobium sp.]|uniref:hypothetical protein n=1 Tax=Novosphingobium sp. TaxID=1874826 RepID=UPI0025DEEFB1|nr:hypothetical protein [Novosphingobium sp.]